MSRASWTIALRAPLAMALRCTVSRSPVAPRSPVHVTTSKPSVSRSQATATEVSSPPEYARTQVSPAYRLLIAQPVARCQSSSAHPAAIARAAPTTRRRRPCHRPRAFRQRRRDLRRRARRPGRWPFPEANGARRDWQPGRPPPDSPRRNAAGARSRRRATPPSVARTHGFRHGRPSPDRARRCRATRSPGSRRSRRRGAIGPGPPASRDGAASRAAGAPADDGVSAQAPLSRGGLEHRADLLAREKPFDLVDPARSDDGRTATGGRGDEAGLDLRKHSTLDRSVVHEPARPFPVEPRDHAAILATDPRDVPDQDQEARPQAPP